jgi:hypothetical protein
MLQSIPKQTKVPVGLNWPPFVQKVVRLRPKKDNQSFRKGLSHIERSIHT